MSGCAMGAQGCKMGGDGFLMAWIRSEVPGVGGVFQLWFPPLFWGGGVMHNCVCVRITYLFIWGGREREGGERAIYF